MTSVVSLDLADVRLPAHKGELRVRGKGDDGGKLRQLLPPPRPTPSPHRLAGGPRRLESADGTPVFLNQHDSRLTDRAARDIITGLGETCGINDDPTDPFGPHVLRHTFATQLIRDGKDAILGAELLGRGSLDTTRRYANPRELHQTARIRRSAAEWAIVALELPQPRRAATPLIT